MIEVSFQHWRYVFLEEELVRYGSPYFDPATTRSQLLPALETRASEESSHQTSFEPAQILCANEAFPEAAVADPLSDLEIWDEWQSGTRAFPHPGRFSGGALFGLGDHRHDGLAIAEPHVSME